MATYPIGPNTNLGVGGSISAGLGTNGGSLFVFNGGTLSIQTAATDLAGTTAGNAYWLQDCSGTVKRVVVALDGYENTGTTHQVVTFPVPFAYSAAIVSQPASFGATVSNTALTLPVSMGAPVTGVIVVEGI